MVHLPRAVVLEGFTFKSKLSRDPFEEDGFYLWFIGSDRNRKFELVTIDADQVIINNNKRNIKRLPTSNGNLILYKLESKYIPDDIHPDGQIQFKGRIGDEYKLTDDLNSNNNTLSPVEPNQPSVIYRPRGRSRGRSRSRSKGGNKKTKKHRKKT